MRQRNPTEYLREGAFLALRDVSEKELKELYQLFSKRLGKPKVSPSIVPGGAERREYKTLEADDLYAKIPLNSWVDTWRDTSQAGQCAYVVVSSRNHYIIESWGQAKPTSQHVTACLRCSLPKPLEDSLR